MRSSDCLSQLRSVLYEPPSRRGWFYVCDLIDQLAGAPHEQKVAVSYVREHTALWPSKLRQAPERWAVAWLRDPAQPPVGWSLVAAVDLSVLEVMWEHTSVSKEHFAHREPHILHLDLSSNEFGNPNDPPESCVPRAILTFLDLPNLQTLDVSSCDETASTFDRLYANRWPKLQTLNFSFNREAPQRLVPSLKHLDLSCCTLDDDDLEDLLSALDAQNIQLQTLDLGSNSLTSASIPLLINSPSTSSLHTLSLASNDLSYYDLNPLLQTPRATSFHKLDLRDLRGSLDDLPALTASPHLANLTKLDLDRTHLSTAYLHKLAHTNLLPSLVWLECGRSGLTDAHLDQLLHSPLLARLSNLSLRHNPISSDALLRLWQPSPSNPNQPQAPHLRNLRISHMEPRLNAHFGHGILQAPTVLPTLHKLDLAANRLGPEGAHSLFTSPQMRTIHSLNLHANTIRAQSLDTPTPHPTPLPLHTLNISHNPLDDELALYLETLGVSSLRDLELEKVGLTYLGLYDILKTSLWDTRPESLSISRNPLTDEAIEILAHAEALDGLEQLTLWDCSLTNPKRAESLLSATHTLRCLNIIHVG